MSTLDQMSLLRGLSGQVAIASPLPSLAFHSSPLSPNQSSPDTESLSDSSSPANDSEEINLSFTPTHHQRLLHELNNHVNTTIAAPINPIATSNAPQHTVFGLDLPYSGHTYPYDLHTTVTSHTMQTANNATAISTPSIANVQASNLIPNMPLLRNNSFGENMAMEPTPLTASSSSSTASASASSSSAASITASLLASAAAHDLFSSLNLPNLSSGLNLHHLPTDSPLHLLGSETKAALKMDMQIPNINKIDANQSSISSSSSTSTSTSIPSNKRSRNERNVDVSSAKDKDSSDENSSPADGGEFDKKMEHRERHRLLDANRRSREAAAVIILQKYAYPEGSKDSAGKIIKTPDKVSVLQRTGTLLQQLTEQNASFASQLHSTLLNTQQLKEEKEKMKSEMQQLRDRLSALELERGDLRQRLQHAAQITNKMQERLVSVSNAAAAAAANATQNKLLPLISEISGKNESALASAAGTAVPPAIRMETPVSLPLFNQNASMSLYESLFINSSIVMLAVNMQGILVAANKGMQRFLAGMNITYDEIIGRPICPFASRPGFAQLRQFLKLQQDREAARLKAAEGNGNDTASQNNSGGNSNGNGHNNNNAELAEQAMNSCTLTTPFDGEITFESTATVAAPLEDERNASPAPAYFARPYPHTAKSMAMLFSGKEQMVTSTHRWISKSGHTWEMQMTSYLVTENGLPSYCVGLTSDDHIVQIS